MSADPARGRADPLGHLGDDTVVITGIGVLSAAGRGLGALSAALRADAPCWSPITSTLPVPRAAMVTVPLPPWDAPDGPFPDDRKAVLGLVALEDALIDAGLAESMPCPPARRGVFLGTGLSSVTPA